MVANIQNLKVPTSEEARENGRKGGIASGKARREKRTMAEILNLLLSEKAGTSNMNCKEAIVLRAIQQAIKGDAKARDFVRDTIGEKPTEKTVTTIDTSPFEIKVVE
jgi:hypothetical protein